MIYASKRNLIEQIEREYWVFTELAASVPSLRYREKGVWGDGWTIHDLLAHLTAWHRLFLQWYTDGAAGRVPVMPAPGYKWSQLADLNQAIWRTHHSKSTATVLREFDISHREVLALARRLPEEALLKPGHFAWTGAHPLVTYLGPNTVSHYRFAAKVLQRWLKTHQVRC